ncbi:MAG: type I methionyl aminopeptidase [Acidobacteriota bacterium]
MRQMTRRKLGRNDPCHCGSGKKYKKCCLSKDRQQGSTAPSPLRSGGWKRSLDRKLRIELKSQEQIEGIRRAGQLTRKILNGLKDIAKDGVTTGEIDQWVYDTTLAHGARPATLGYKGFPKSCCTSINEVVCHGIPGDRELRSGDIVNIDVTSILDGYYGDASNMYLIGDVAPEARQLVEVTKECLDLGIGAVQPNGRIGDIGHAIQTHAESLGFSVVRQFVGHGIGTKFHESVQVPHFGKPGDGPWMVPGMVFTIEPMINAGRYGVKILDDDWTAVTRDGSLSAQWEHTIAVTETGVDILTA